jgi:hypothetical protein
MGDKPDRKRWARWRHGSLPQPATKPAIDPDKLYSDGELLKVVTCFTEADLECARDTGSLHYINVPGKGPRSRGWQVLNWLDDMLSG